MDHRAYPSHGTPGLGPYNGGYAVWKKGEPPVSVPHVAVNRKAEGRLESGHPWIFSSDVTSRGEAQPGDAVQVVTQRGRPLGMAHYSESSQITLRMLARSACPIDRTFYDERLREAEAYRRRFVRDTTGYRAVHAEADGLPALIVDRYGDYLAVQTLNQGMDRAKETILDALQALYQPRGIVLRNDAPVRVKESLPLETRVGRGDVPGPVAIRMNGLDWEADLLEGQKTGIYFDQRENYLAAARFAGGRALDCFTSTGGFALHLAAVCESVEGADSSSAAIAAAERNRDRNGITNALFREADIFSLLAGYAHARQQFDTIVLDPPAFAKSRGAREGALRGYKEINVRALRLLAPGGVLVTCSCSFHIAEADLLEVVAEAALDTRRTLRVLDRRTQALDHPVLLTVPETMYLKCLIFEAAG